MSSASDLVLAPMVRKLEYWHPFSEEERLAVLGLPHLVRALKPHQFVIWDGDGPQHACLLLSGFAFRHKLVGNGARQILSIHMKGDLIDLQNSLLGVADHNVQMITTGTSALIPVQAVADIAFRFPAVGLATRHSSKARYSVSGLSMSGAVTPSPPSPIFSANSLFEWRLPSSATR